MEFRGSRNARSSSPPSRLLEQPEKKKVVYCYLVSCPFHTPLPEFLPAAGPGSGGDPGQPRRF